MKSPAAIWPKALVAGLELAMAAASLSSCATATSPAAPEARSARLRQELEAVYEVNRQALLSREPAAVLALRTEDFHVVTPDGATHDAVEMANFTRNLLENVDRWEALSFDIQGVEQQGDEVRADVRQHSIRMMRRPGGNIQRVENWVTQSETWVRMAEGWKIRRVDNIRDQHVLIDGVPRS